MNPAILIPILAPILQDVIRGKVVPTPAASADAIAAEVIARLPGKIASDPVVRNEMNAEAPHQSRVVLGTSTSILGAVAILLPILLGLFGIDVSTDRIVEIVGAVMTLSGAAYALYGRLASGLKPLFTRG